MASKTKRPTKKQAPRRGAVTAELGMTGLKRTTGFVHDEFLRQLKGRNAIKVYNEMESNDPIIGAMLFLIEMLIRQVDWRVEPAGEDNRSMEEAEFLESNMFDMSTSWSDTIAEILSYLIFGWSFHEIVYKHRLGDVRDPTKRSRHDDGRIGWRKLPIRAQSTLIKWFFDADGGVQGMQQRDPNRGKSADIPIEKALLFRTTINKGSPEGRSILRRAYRPWYFKKRIEEVEAIGAERDLAGYPVAKIPAQIIGSTNATEKQQYQNWQDVVRDIRRDEQEGLVIPSDRWPESGHPMYEMTLLTTGGRRQIDTDKMLNRYARWITMTSLADVILMGHEKVGSFSLASSKTGMLATALGGFLDSMEDVLNVHGASRLYRLNGVPSELWGKFRHGDVEKVDMDEFSAMIERLARAGVDTTDPNTDAWVRQSVGMPEKLEEEEDGADEGAQPADEDEQRRQKEEELEPSGLSKS